jgi:hypothetical protein
VRQHHVDDLVDLSLGHGRDPPERRQRLGGLARHQVGAVPVDGEGDAELGDRLQDRPRHLDLGEPLDRGGNALGLLGLRLGVAGAEGLGILLPGFPALDDLDPVLDIADTGDVDAQTEAVEQLRSQLALLRVHGADQDEARRVPHRDALALDDVDPHRRRVEQDVDEVVVEEVDLVDVEDVAVGLGQHPRLEALGPGLDRGLDVDAADDAVLGGVDGQLHDAHPAVPRG